MKKIPAIILEGRRFIALPREEILALLTTWWNLLAIGIPLIMMEKPLFITWNNFLWIWGKKLILERNCGNGREMKENEIVFLIEEIHSIYVLPKLKFLEWRKQYLVQILIIIIIFFISAGRFMFRSWSYSILKTVQDIATQCRHPILNTLARFYQNSSENQRFKLKGVCIPAVFFSYPLHL